MGFRFVLWRNGYGTSTSLILEQGGQPSTTTLLCLRSACGGLSGSVSERYCCFVCLYFFTRGRLRRDTSNCSVGRSTAHDWPSLFMPIFCHSWIDDCEIFSSQIAGRLITVLNRRSIRVHELFNHTSTGRVLTLGACSTH